MNSPFWSHKNPFSLESQNEWERERGSVANRSGAMGNGNGEWDDSVQSDGEWGNRNCYLLFWSQNHWNFGIGKKVWSQNNKQINFCYYEYELI